jgi:hypothetical protein
MPVSLGGAQSRGRPAALPPLLAFHGRLWGVPGGGPHNSTIKCSCLCFAKITEVTLLTQDPMKKKKARNMVRTKFEERYKSGKNRY